MDNKIEVATGTKGMEELQKALGEPTPGQIEKFKQLMDERFKQYVERGKVRKSKHKKFTSKELEQKIEKKRKVKRKISNASRKVNQLKNRHNKYTK